MFLFVSKAAKREGVLESVVRDSMLVRSFKEKDRRQHANDVLPEYFSGIERDLFNSSAYQTLKRYLRMWGLRAFNLGAVNTLSLMGVDARSPSLERWKKSFTAEKAAGEVVFELTDQEVLDALENRVIKHGAGITDDVIRSARGMVRNHVYLGTDDTQAIAERLAAAEGIPEWRALKIARTETQVAYNQASFEMSRRSGVKRNFWITVGDNRVRDEHIANEVSGAIPLGEAFPSGQYHPGDGALSINCRCSLQPDLSDPTIILQPWDGSPQITIPPPVIPKKPAQPEQKPVLTEGKLPEGVPVSVLDDLETAQAAGHERFFIVDDAGKVTHQVDGGASTAQLTDEMKAVLRTGDGSNVTFHNHPVHSTFSHQDVGLFAGSGGRHYAIDPDYIYGVHFPEKLSENAARKLAKKYAGKDVKLSVQLQKWEHEQRLLGKQVTEAQRMRKYAELSHEEMVTFSRENGFEYRRYEKPVAEKPPQLPETYTPVRPNEFDTFGQYTDEAGNWSGERRLLHDDIVGTVTGEATPVEKPTAYMMGGGPASGKSNLLRQGKVTLPKNRVTVDPDDLKGMLPEYREMIAAKNPQAAAIAHEESSYLSKRVLQESLNDKKNVMLDGTGDSSYAKLKAKVQAMKDAGSKVEAHYVTIDTDEAIKRSTARAKRSGRKVPEEFIRECHATISEILPKALDDGLFDEIVLWDNTLKVPRKVMSQVNGKTVIHDEALWQQFLRKSPEYKAPPPTTVVPELPPTILKPAPRTFEESKEWLRGRKVHVVRPDPDDAIPAWAAKRTVGYVADEVDSLVKRFPVLANADSMEVQLVRGEIFVADTTAGKGSRVYGTYSWHNNTMRIATELKPPANTVLGGFNVGQDISTAFRHEYGHHLHNTMKLPKTAKGRTYSWQRIADGYIYDKKPLNLSTYAKTDNRELFAESFAVYTDPKYVRGTLPRDIEDFFDAFLDVKKASVTPVVPVSTRIAAGEAIPEIVTGRTTSLRAARAEAKKTGAPRIVAKSSDAADYMTEGAAKHIEDLRKVNPEMAADAPSLEQIKKNWMKQFRQRDRWNGKGAFADIDPQVELRVQNAANYNHSIEKFTQFQEKFGEQKILLMNLEKNGKALAEYRGRTTTFYQYKFNAGPDHPTIGERAAFLENLSDPKTRKRYVGHMTDEGGIAGTLRHEYGHQIHELMGPEKQAEWQKSFFMRVSEDDMRKGLSDYATTNANEMLAELFTLVTHPQYVRSSYPAWVGEAEDFLLGLL